jgi:hypothetical protein
MPFCRKAKRDKHCRERYMRAFPPVDGKCRCVYCGRWIPAKRIEVDHVIPVQRCAGSLLVRLFLCDFSNVNDVRNLRYACYQCNAKKGASLNVIWKFRASVGMSGTYWVLKRVIRTGFSVAVILFTIYISIPCAR